MTIACRRADRHRAACDRKPSITGIRARGGGLHAEDPEILNIDRRAAYISFIHLQVVAIGC